MGGTFNMTSTCSHLTPTLPGPPGHDRVTGGARGRFACAGGTGGSGQGAR